MCHLTEMKHNTIHFFTFHTTDITKCILNTNFKRMEIIKFINKLTTNLYIYRKCDIVHNNIGSVEQFIVIVNIYNTLNTLAFSIIITFNISLTID